jgi:hypothetical protein
VFFGIIFPERYILTVKKSTKTPHYFHPPFLFIRVCVCVCVCTPKYKLFFPHPLRTSYYSISLENLTFSFHSLPMTSTQKRRKGHTEPLHGWEISVDLYLGFPSLVWMIYTLWCIGGRFSATTVRQGLICLYARFQEMENGRCITRYRMQQYEKKRKEWKDRHVEM